jgi:hypothetical protein
MRILGRQANALVVFLLVGLMAGALVGYGTRPEKIAEIRIGPINIEVQGRNIARSQDGELTSTQAEHIAIFTLIGGLIGLGLGFAIQRGKIRL